MTLDIGMLMSGVLIFGIGVFVGFVITEILAAYSYHKKSEKETENYYLKMNIKQELRSEVSTMIENYFKEMKK